MKDGEWFIILNVHLNLVKVLQLPSAYLNNGFVAHYCFFSFTFPG